MTVATLIFIFMGKKITLRERLAIQESLVQFNLQGLVRLTRVIAVMTLSFEAAGALLLMIAYIPQFGAGKGIYYSIFHSISAFCNAGFDLFGTANAPYQGYSIFATNFFACFPLLMLIIAGGLGFSVIRDGVMSRKWSRLNIHSKIVLLVSGALIIVSTLFFLIAEYNNPATMGNLLRSKLLARFPGCHTENCGLQQD
jgi:trk system potassium uptake protein TrkH